MFRFVLDSKLGVSFCLFLISVLLVGCDPNSLLAELVSGEGYCEQATSALAECCSTYESATYPNACSSFNAGVTEAAKTLLSEQCEANEDTFIGPDTCRTAVLAANIKSMACEELLQEMETLFSACGISDGDENPDGDQETEEPPDGDDPDGDIETGICPPERDGKGCDDGNLCTVEDVCDDGACEGSEKDCSEMEDICNDAACVEGECVAAPLADETPCGDNNACTIKLCLSGTCVTNFVEDDTECDDEDPCTEDDKCAVGDCIGRQLDCSNLDESCASGICSEGECTTENKSDETPCTHENLCVTSASCNSGVCIAENIRDCSGMDDECNIGVCTVSGCEKSPREDGTDCEEGNLCTENDKCELGVCKDGQVKSCSDGINCTSETCNPATGVCDAEIDDNFCLIDDVCYNNLDPNPVIQDCQLCDSSLSKSSWSNRNDGYGCNDANACTTGDRCLSGLCQDYVELEDCDDELDCTIDACDSVSGNCFNDLDTGYCLIDGICYDADAPNPAELECQSCQTAKSTSEWSNRTDGTDCDDEDECTQGDRCQSGTCSDQLSTTNCSDNLDCTTDSCDPLTADCSNDLDEGNCLIETVCYATDDPNPEEIDCQSCQPDKATDAWSNLPDTTECNDQNECTLGDKCLSGLCQDSDSTVECTDNLDCTTDLCNPVDGECNSSLLADKCLIDNVCYDTGDPNPEQPVCSACQSALDTDDWSNVNEESSCSDNLCHENDQCDAGVCVFTEKQCPPLEGYPCWAPICLEEDGSCNFDLEVYDGQVCDPGYICEPQATCNLWSCECETDGNGSLEATLLIEDTGTASPLCIDVQITSEDWTELAANLVSPAGTPLSPLLHDHQAIESPGSSHHFVIETTYFSAEDRAGVWRLILDMDQMVDGDMDQDHELEGSPSSSTLKGFSLTFDSCPQR